MPSANLSFYINDTQESDSGLYMCIVIIPGAPSISGQIYLNVKGNVSAASKVAPNLGGFLPRLENPEHVLPDQWEIVGAVCAKTEEGLRRCLCCLQWIKPEGQVQRWDMWSHTIIWHDPLLPTVPPSPPVCTLTGSPVVKGNVTLSCKSSQGKPVPQYKWTKAAPTSEVFFSPMQSEWTSRDSSPS